MKRSKLVDLHDAEAAMVQKYQAALERQNTAQASGQQEIHKTQQALT